MQVIAGVAIPQTAPDMEAAKALVAYMLQPETQIATLRATNFFPVVDVTLPDDMPASVKALGARHCGDDRARRMRCRCCCRWGWAS